MLTLMYALHGVAKVFFLLPSDADAAMVDRILQQGLSDSEKQACQEYFVLLRVQRRRECVKYFLDGDTQWQIPIMTQVMLVLDGLTYTFLGEVTVCDLLGRDGSIIAAAQADLLNLLSSWGLDESVDEWKLVDAARVPRRGDPSQDIRLFARRQLLLSSSSIAVRLERPMSCAPHTLHYGVCRKCTPSIDGRRRVLENLANYRPSHAFVLAPLLKTGGSLEC
jgi:hypothetical protein